jgi:hypothetical protein
LRVFEQTKCARKAPPFDLFRGKVTTLKICLLYLPSMRLLPLFSTLFLLLSEAQIKKADGETIKQRVKVKFSVEQTNGVRAIKGKERISHR